MDGIDIKDFPYSRLFGWNRRRGFRLVVSQTTKQALASGKLTRVPVILNKNGLFHQSGITGLEAGTLVRDLGELKGPKHGKVR